MTGAVRRTGNVVKPLAVGVIAGALSYGATMMIRWLAGLAADTVYAIVSRDDRAPQKAAGLLAAITVILTIFGIYEVIHQAMKPYMAYFRHSAPFGVDGITPDGGQTTLDHDEWDGDGTHPVIVESMRQADPEDLPFTDPGVAQ